jgi:hypothetical protein
VPAQDLAPAGPKVLRFLIVTVVLEIRLSFTFLVACAGAVRK